MAFYSKKSFAISILLLTVSYLEPTHAAQDNMPQDFQIAQTTSEYAKEYEQAMDYAKQNYYVRAIYSMLLIDFKSPFYEKAQHQIAEWKIFLKKFGTSYEKEMEKFQQEYQNIEGAIAEMESPPPEQPQPDQEETSDEDELSEETESSDRQAVAPYQKAISLIQAVKPNSPFYDKAQGLLVKVKELQTAREKEEVSEDTGEDWQTDDQEFIESTAKTIDLSLFYRGAYPISGNSFNSGGGLGLSFYPWSFLGFHSEFNAFYSKDTLSFLVPLTIRYRHLIGQSSLYAGLGGMLTISNGHLPWGGLLEAGYTVALTDNFSLLIGLDYGLTLQPQIFHTLGIKAGISYGW